MQAFGVLSELTVRTNQFVRRYESIPATDAVDVGKLIISVPGELKGVTDSIEKAEESLSVEEKQSKKNKQIVLVSEEALFNWHGMPMRLGRVSFGFVGTSKHHHLEEEPLRFQLSELKRKYQNKYVFRIAIVNSFGTNLGDNLVGVTALRHLAKALSKHFELFSIDVLCGPATHKHVASVFRGEPYVGQVLWLGPTLQDFSRYAGYFDFSNLINEPRYVEMPAVDWCLWWMGLNPDSYPAVSKRNSKTYDWAVWCNSKRYLPTSKTLKIFLSHRASVPLRTFPGQLAAEFVKKVLQQNGDIAIITDQTLPVQHPRFHDLSAHKLSMPECESVIAQCDGMVTVDTYALHLADACSLPAVVLCSSMPATHYPYYPYVEVLELPGAKELPAYTKPKVQDAEWEKMATAYLSAWEKLSSSKVINSLREKIKKREVDKQLVSSVRFDQGAPALTPLIELADGTKALRYAVARPSAIWTAKRFGDILAATSRVGTHVVAAGVGAEIQSIVKRAPYASYSIFEPRAFFANTAVSNFLFMGFIGYTLYPTVPMGAGPDVFVEDHDPWSDIDVYGWGNCRKKIKLPCRPMTDFTDKKCDIMLVQPPMPAVKIINDCYNLIRATLPIIMISPMKKSDIGAIAGKLAEVGYDLWAEVVPGGDAEYLFLALPKVSEIVISGFTKIEISK